MLLHCVVVVVETWNHSISSALLSSLDDYASSSASPRCPNSNFFLVFTNKWFIICCVNNARSARLTLQNLRCESRVLNLSLLLGLLSTKQLLVFLLFRFVLGLLFGFTLKIVV